MRSILIALTVLLSSTALAQQPDLSQSGLVGKLENPTLVTDPAQWPKKFGEAPALAELVKAGKLPPVEQRLPQEPMVIKPLRSVGKYGGTWRRGFLGPGDSENGNRVRSSDKLLFWDVNGTSIVPNAAKGWEDERRRPAYHPVPAQGYEVVGRRALHRRRLRVLVRGHVSKQRSHQIAGAGTRH